MAELRVRGDGDDLGPQCGQLGVLCREVGQFGRTNKGEVCRVKDEDRPFAVLFQIGKVNFTKRTAGRLVGFHLELWHVLPHANRGQITVNVVREI